MEPFGGSGAVLFSKTPSAVEIYNDIDQGLVNLFRVLRSPSLSSQLAQLLELTPYSRSEFEDAKVATAGDRVEQARRFIVRQRQSFGAMGDSWAHSLDKNGKVASVISRWRKAIDRLPEAVKRLTNVQIECQGWKELIPATDSDQTLFYLDPPYISTTRVNGEYLHEMSLDAHRDLINALLKLRGMAILSGYASQEYLPLELRGWLRIDLKVRAFSSDTRSKRVESLWLSPSITSRDPARYLPEPKTVVDKLRAGAFLTHQIRKSESEKKITAAIRAILKQGKPLTANAIADLSSLTPRHISRKYRHLLLDQ